MEIVIKPDLTSWYGYLLIGNLAHAKFVFELFRKLIRPNLMT